MHCNDECIFHLQVFSHHHVETLMKTVKKKSNGIKAFQLHIAGSESVLIIEHIIDSAAKISFHLYNDAI